ncbi:MAG: hypothetical protein KGJ62_02305 [Armatimonadetes bacterium]|nr:hypothetical protein [Armatimonadota bacterium]MDE2205347.1 hypothetical protein [Armatimonadota bacterium]
MQKLPRHYAYVPTVPLYAAVANGALGADSVWAVGLKSGRTAKSDVAAAHYLEAVIAAGASIEAHLRTWRLQHPEVMKRLAAQRNLTRPASHATDGATTGSGSPR